MSVSPHDIPSITSPQPYTISFPQEDIDQFHRKLKDARLPSSPLYPGLPEGKRAGGGNLREFNHKTFPNLERLKELLELWKQSDLKQMEHELNQYPHFITKVDWCDRLHFIHHTSTRKDAIPILLCHGWPGSFKEFLHVIKPLAEPQDADAQAFHVVVPSMPGYTFSTPAPTPELGTVTALARLYDGLMCGLGYERYAVQGGDWGSIVAREVARRARSDGTGCRACHLNFLPMLPTPLGKTVSGVLLSMPEWATLRVGKYMFDEECYRALEKSLLYMHHGSVYYVVQANRPSQLGFGCIDSPVALLGWMGYFTMGLNVHEDSEKRGPKRREGEKGAIEAFFPNYETLNVQWLLDEAWLYWVTSSTATSFRSYSDNQHFLEYITDPKFKIQVPFGYSGFPDEIIDAPLRWVHKYGNVTDFRWYAKAPVGGHMAAVERPEVFVKHLRAAFAPQGIDPTSTPGGNKSRFGPKGDKEAIYTEGSIWRKGGLWDDERRKHPGAYRPVSPHRSKM